MFNSILCDTRWVGAQGIGRFASETISRLPNAQPLPKGFAPHPFHPLEIPCLSASLLLTRPQVYFSPGFNPPVWSPVPFVFTIHDLIPLHFPDAYSLKMQFYFSSVVRRAAQQASFVLTVSEYSRRDIMCWANLPEERVVNVGCGVGLEFNTDGLRHAPGYPYLFYVGSRRPQKNLPRLFKAFSQAKISPEIRLLLSGHSESEVIEEITQLGLKERVVFAGSIQDEDLPAYYRGALALVFPSLYEGFGLPPLESMACGTPVLTSNVTSLPEVVGDAAVMVDPFDVEAIAQGIERIVEDETLRNQLKIMGLDRAKKFTWERTAKLTAQVLEQAINQ